MYNAPIVEIVNTILVVEDEALIKMATADYLRDCGYRVFEADTVDEAIELLRVETDVDLVFTDVQMPGGRNGFDLCRWIRANMPQVRVMLTSGKTQAADVAKDLCYAGPFVNKPYHLDDVLANIRSLSECDAYLTTAA